MRLVFVLCCFFLLASCSIGKLKCEFEDLSTFEDVSDGDAPEDVE